ncbi:actin-like protein ARP6 [Coprinopsis sp. MPI-PUGE-AT-0042]|nr:actin-like protein ARP6 [Coprinopsis sp. MPI-PUGE-AT-0042]
MQKNIVILDNGGHSIKTGLLNSRTRHVDPRVVPNAVVKTGGDKATYIGHEINTCEDYASLKYRLPIEKGYVVDWDAQKAVWDGIFSDQVLSVDTTESTLLVTEPYFNLPNIQETYDQFIFEEYECHSYYRCTGASLAPLGGLFSQPSMPPPQYMVIVDSGFSFTHVVPIMEGRIVWPATKRLDVGGKLLTNHLKEVVSFQQWNMMEETYIMNHVKETCCFVSTDFQSDLETCRKNTTANPIVREYVLPDFTRNRHGQIRQADTVVTGADQTLVMNSERFAVPEVIFRPYIVGLQQAGLAETIAHSISLLPDDLQGMFWSNIGLIGGNCKLPGFRTRLMQELQPLAPTDWDVCIYESEDPVTAVYKSAFRLARRTNFGQQCVTRAEYAESGSNASKKKFKDWLS